MTNSNERCLKTGATTKRRMALCTLSTLCWLLSLPAWSQGIPFFRNYASTEYMAHNQNFDIVTATDGTIFVANFEGLLYYDQASWRIIHTPGINRVTSLFRDSKGTLWAGGYNYIGHITVSENGILGLQPVGEQQHGIHGEVTSIWETGNTLYAQVSDGNKYIIGDSTLTPTNMAPKTETIDLVQEMGTHVNQVLELEKDMRAIATSGEGVVITNSSGEELCRINEDNGLCSDNVNRIAYNGHGLLWGATNNGIFAIAIPTIYSHFTASEGLRGEVLCLETLGKDTYVGTLNGLFVLKGSHFEHIKEIALACWQLTRQGDRLLAATAEGLFAIGPGRKTEMLSTANTISVMPTDSNTFLTGEIDGVYLNRKGRGRQKIWDIEKVVRMERDKEGVLWMQGLYGSVWSFRGNVNDSTKPTPYKANDNEIRTLVNYKGQVTPIASDDTQAYPFPLFSYADDEGLLWLTDNKGKQLYAMQDDKMEEQLSRMVYPLMDYAVRTMKRRGQQLWMGGDKGLCIVDNDRQDPTFTTTPKLHLRAVRLHGDSILWGGYGPQPTEMPSLASNERHISFDYSTDCPSLLLPTQYRSRLNGGNWSAWETRNYEEYSNLTYGNFRFEVQARDAFGRLSDIVAVDFSITPPLHLRWYMLLLYATMLLALGYALMKFRLYRLEKDKRRLESVVQERTADLVKAQNELVRQEKMATVGKLTKGLIDRILNPLNYINNFAKLSENLIKDAKENIEDEKENISPETYEDTIEVLNMLEGNLKKVGEHGASTSKVLKAMEEMLKERSGEQINMNLSNMLRQNEKMLNTYYEKEIKQNAIRTPFVLPQEDINIKGNPELLSTTVMSLLRNAIYAVAKKRLRLQQETINDNNYIPEVRLELTTKDAEEAIITIRDNGIGIESTIIDRIFDPFFTTKTTGEASGVGLYISKEIAQNHGGDINVNSIKGQYTEFTINIPIKPQEPAYGS